MARQKKEIEPIKKPRTLKPKKECGKCQKSKTYENFYKSSNDDYADGLHPICKNCVIEQVDTNNLQSVKEQLIKLNRPFLSKAWESTVKSAQNKEGNVNVFGLYLKNLQLNYKDYTWKDSDNQVKLNNNFNGNNIINNANQSNNYNIQKEIIDVEYNSVEQQPIILHNNIPITNEIIEKWGEGYTPEEYRAFERKYVMLKNHYQERTAMHTEALITYIRYRVKEEIATSKNESKAAKEWGAMAKDAATAAKINPSQLSKADLSDGMDNFGQLVRSVEQAVDIIEILPRFKEKPADKVDFTIWCYVNYVRDLKSLPLATYKEIYQFYEVRKKEYEDNGGIDFDNLDFETDYENDDLYDIIEEEEEVD